MSATMRSKSSSANWSSGDTTMIPALLTSTLSRPRVQTVSATAFFTALASALSARIANALPPADSMARTTSSAFACALGYVIAAAAPACPNVSQSPPRSYAIRR